MILSCNNIKKTYIDDDVLKDVSFHINEKDKVALIGQNGCGKTTLIRIIMGIEHADKGLVTISKDTSIGYLPQNALLDSKKSIYDELLSVKQDLIDFEKQIELMHSQMEELDGDSLLSLISKTNDAMHTFEQMGGYIYKSEAKGILLGLGFTKEDFEKSVDVLSGGQKTRVALGKILFINPDLIILDEPTNHLDMNSISWLENYLLNLKKTVFVVSHDRYFIDKFVNKIVEIEGGTATTFEGNYSDYAVKKEYLRIAAINAYVKQQAMIEHQEEVIRKLKSYNREKSLKRANSRIKMLDKLDRIDKPKDFDDTMSLTLAPRYESGKDVLDITGLAKSYDKLNLFSNIDIHLKRGEHVAIIGDNGTGKTTLLKIINGIEKADSGLIELGSKVIIGYYDQEYHVLDDNKSIFDEISDAYPTLNNTQIRNVLAAFLYTGDDILKRIGSLSGGEKGRVSLAKLMLSEANLLILDEPTNHLDITSKEVLEQALNAYEGTLLYVSHDRYFINRTADRILDLRNNIIDDYLGDYDYYLEKRETIRREYSTNNIGSSNNCSYEEQYVTKVNDVDIEVDKNDSKSDWQASKQKQAKLRKQNQMIKECEAKIATLEEEKMKLENMMSDVAIATNSAKLNEISGRIEEIDDKLYKLMDDWEELLSELD